jgi:hypothetical protein
MCIFKQKKKNQAPSSTTADEGENLAQSPIVSKPGSKAFHSILAVNLSHFIEFVQYKCIKFGY